MISAATGRSGFTIDSFLNAACKFAPGREISEEAILEVAGERAHISKEVPLFVGLDKAGFVEASQAKRLLGGVGDL